MTIDVFSMEPAIPQRLKRLADKALVLHGDPFGEPTVHRHAPIMMNISAVARRRMLALGVSRHSWARHCRDRCETTCK